MTIVVSVQCSEGIVLAADSAITVGSDQSGFVWPHAKKLSHIGKYNIGTLSFGLGAIGQRNIQSLMYEFEVNEHFGCNSGDEITVSGVTNALHSFLNQKYIDVFGADSTSSPVMGMIIAGYSQNSFMPEQYRFTIPGNRAPIKINFPSNVGIILMDYQMQYID